ncbi:hypothetical protein G6F35_019030 [Rhizopus arrhizus]|nr:hypothetical protein G6F35_019030 [Rhizopus arrhizus]
MAIAVSQLASQVLDPALQSRALLAHALGRIAQRRGISDHQQVAVVQVLAAPHLPIGQCRGQAQPLQQGLSSEEHPSELQ